MKELKPIDYKLLFELMKDSHRSDRQLAKALGVSQPTVTRRRGLLEENYIEGYTIIPKLGKIGFEIAAFTFLKGKLKQKTGQERDKAQRFLDIAGTMILALDSQYNVTMINQKGCELLECEEGGIVGTNWIEEYIPENSRAEALEYLKSIVAGGPSGSCEMIIETPKGVQKKIHCQDRALTDDEGKVTTILCSAQEIETDEKDASLIVSSYSNSSDNVPVIRSSRHVTLFE